MRQNMTYVMNSASLNLMIMKSFYNEWTAHALLVQAWQDDLNIV